MDGDISDECIRIAVTRLRHNLYENWAGGWGLKESDEKLLASVFVETHPEIEATDADYLSHSTLVRPGKVRTKQ
jgi:hypothetical protein